MQFSLKTLLLIAPLAILTLYLWDITYVTKADGGRDIHVEIDGRDNEQIASIRYAAVRARDLARIKKDFPYIETVFHDVTQQRVTVRVSWSSTTSASGRLLDYGESFDMILFLIKRHSKNAEFRTLEIPNFRSGNRLKVSL